MTAKPFEEYLAYSGKDAVITWKEYRASAADNRKKTITFDTGYPEFDSFVGGVASGELIVVSGNTGQGKTLFVKSLVKNFAAQDVPTTVFSYEVPTDQFLESYEDLPRCETVYVPKELKTNDVSWIREKVIEARAKYDNKIVVIDHLHYIVEMSSQKNFSLTVGEALRKLKQEIAISLNQVVVLICHQQSLGGDTEPSISTIRDSSFTGQEADMVLIVHRIPDATYKYTAQGAHDKKEKIPPQDWTYDNGQAFVKIDKARRTGVYKKKCTFQKKGAWLEPL
jgi:replicative DNA helicase